MEKLSIVVPCYNEEKNIPLIVERFKELTDRVDEEIELILVNNGSGDNSEAVLQEVVATNKFVKTVKVEVNQGYGYGIIQGLKAATAKYLSWTHADMQSDPLDFIQGIKIIKNNNSDKLFVKGRRKERPLLDAFFTFGMSCFVSLMFGRRINDISAQPTIFNRSLIENKFDTLPWDFALDMYIFILAKKENFSVIRFPVIFGQRAHGESSWNTGMSARIKLIKRYFSLGIKLRLKGV